MRSLCLIIVRVAWPASFILDILRAMNIARGSVPARVAVLTILSPLFASSLLVCLGRDPGAERGRRASRGRRVEESGREEVDLGGGGATEEVEERLALGGERARARGRQRARGHAVQPLCGSVKVHRMRCQSVAGTPRSLNHPGAMKIKDK